MNNRLRFILRPSSLTNERSNATHDVIGKVRVTISAVSTSPVISRLDPPLSIGDEISITGKIKKPRNFHNPGGFDYERFMAFQGIWATTFVKADRVQILARHPGGSIRQAIEDTRRRIAHLVDSSRCPGSCPEEKAVLRALIIGDRSGISRDLRNAFNRAGAGHLLAISGLHVGIVATVSFFMFQWMLAFWRPLLWRAWTRKGAAILSFFPVVFYGLIAGMSPSTQRAVLMVTVFLMTFLFEREHDLMNTLALAALVILGIHPPALFSVSFLLSFGAVFSIIYGLSRIPEGWRATRSPPEAGRIIRFLARGRLFLLVSFFAILGTLPPVMYFFNQASLIGLFTNCLMVPLVGFLVVPLGLFAVLLYPLWSYGAGLITQAGLMILQLGIGLTRWLADLPFAATKTVTPNLLEIACYYLLAWAVLNLGAGRGGIAEGGRWSFRMPFRLYFLRDGKSMVDSLRQMGRSALGRISGMRLPTIVLLSVLSVAVLDVCYWWHQRFLRQDLRITAIDVGQGSGALVELPGGSCFLLDGGGFSDNTIFDVGERIIAPLLWRKKIMTVDALILSHPNSDHLNGLLYIADHFNVKTIWTNNDVSDTLGYRELIATINRCDIEKPDYADIDRIQEIGGVTFHVLYPPDRIPDRSHRESWRTFNNNSLVVKLTYGAHTFLFPGDIMTAAENEIVAIHGDDLQSTVLMAPHHGSRTSSTPAFLSKVKPAHVIVSAGWRNSFGFPHPTVLKRYTEKGCRVYSTAQNGAIRMITDGQHLTIETTIDGTT